MTSDQELYDIFDFEQVAQHEARRITREERAQELDDMFDTLLTSQNDWRLISREQRAQERAQALARERLAKEQEQQARAAQEQRRREQEQEQKRRESLRGNGFLTREEREELDRRMEKEMKREKIVEGVGTVLGYIIGAIVLVPCVFLFGAVAVVGAILAILLPFFVINPFDF